MYVSHYELINGWCLKKRLEDTEDLIITTVLNKNVPGNWIMKIKCISFYEEISGIEKYLTGCENAVSIPKNITWHGIDEDRQFRWYVMQQYDGDISKKCLFTKKYIQIFLKDVVNFLKHIHLQGAVHGDIKMKNILYTENFVKFYVCDYEFLSAVANNRKNNEKYLNYIDYYYSYLGIPSGKPKFSYKADLTAFGYILWSIFISEKDTDTQFKWQQRAINLYNLKEESDYLSEIDKERDNACKEMPVAIRKYFTFLEKLSWANETPPEGIFYDELGELRLE